MFASMMWAMYSNDCLHRSPNRIGNVYSVLIHSKKKINLLKPMNLTTNHIDGLSSEIYQFVFLNYF